MNCQVVAALSVSCFQKSIKMIVSVVPDVILLRIYSLQPEKNKISHKTDKKNNKNRILTQHKRTEKTE